MKLDRVTGFQTVSATGEIRDANGLFYAWMMPRRFNLPAGQYIVTKGSIKALPAPVRWVKPTGRRRKPVAFRIAKIAQGIAYAVQIPGKVGKILINPEALAGLPTPVRAFVLFHEAGHLNDPGNWSEYFADKYAATQMLRSGYNPSQIVMAANIISFSPERRKALLTFAQKWTI